MSEPTVTTTSTTKTKYTQQWISANCTEITASTTSKNQFGITLTMNGAATISYVTLPVGWPNTLLPTGSPFSCRIMSIKSPFDVKASGKVYNVTHALQILEGNGSATDTDFLKADLNYLVHFSSTPSGTLLGVDAYTIAGVGDSTEEVVQEKHVINGKVITSSALNTTFLISDSSSKDYEKNLEEEQKKSHYKTDEDKNSMSGMLSAANQISTKWIEDGPTFPRTEVEKLLEAMISIYNESFKLHSVSDYVIDSTVNAVRDKVKGEASSLLDQEITQESFDALGNAATAVATASVEFPYISCIAWVVAAFSFIGEAVDTAVLLIRQQHLIADVNNMLDTIKKNANLSEFKDYSTALHTLTVIAQKYRILGEDTHALALGCCYDIVSSGGTLNTTTLRKKLDELAELGTEQVSAADRRTFLAEMMKVKGIKDEAALKEQFKKAEAVIENSTRLGFTGLGFTLATAMAFKSDKSWREVLQISRGTYGRVVINAKGELEAGASVAEDEAVLWTSRVRVSKWAKVGAGIGTTLTLAMTAFDIYELAEKVKLKNKILGQLDTAADQAKEYYKSLSHSSLIST